jgi:aspartyl/asparaginyl beta-hydroxylase (cupin superfamily)
MILTRAIRTAQLKGFWHSKNSTPAWLHEAVPRAMDYARQGQYALFYEWLAPIEAKFGTDEMKRVRQCIAMYVGEEPTVYADPRQKPSFLYFPGLPIAPVFPRAALSFADWYEAETDAIRREMLHVLEQSTDVGPFHYRLKPSQRMKATRGDWDAYFFFSEGEPTPSHHEECPHTSSVLARLPLDRVAGHGPEVCYSVLRPGAHIRRHRGVTNTRAVLHLGLVIPDGCALNLPGITEVHWQEGKCFAFDDTYEHEAWNQSGRTRVVLLGDIWNPYLTEAEREAVAMLVTFISDFNRKTDPPPGLDNSPRKSYANKHVP